MQTNQPWRSQHQRPQIGWIRFADTMAMATEGRSGLSLESITNQNCPKGPSLLQSLYIHGTWRQAPSDVLGRQMARGRIHERPRSIPHPTSTEEN
jgi:hypothetical protein